MAQSDHPAAWVWGSTWGTGFMQPISSETGQNVAAIDPAGSPRSKSKGQACDVSFLTCVYSVSRGGWRPGERLGGLGGSHADHSRDEAKTDGRRGCEVCRSKRPPARDFHQLTAVYKYDGLKGRWGRIQREMLYRHTLRLMGILVSPSNLGNKSPPPCSAVGAPLLPTLRKFIPEPVYQHPSWVRHP